MYREDDDAPSARFRARFRRGARLDVMRPAEAGGNSEGPLVKPQWKPIGWVS